MNKRLKIIGYLGFAFLFYLIFLFFTFPYGVLKTRIVREVEKQLGPEYSFKIGSMDVTIFGNLKLGKVQLIKHVRDKDIVLVETSKLKLNPSLIGLVFGNTSLSFTLKGDSGELEGSFAQSSGKVDVELNFDELSAKNIQLLKEMGITYNGILDGEVEISLYPKTPAKNEGSVNLQFINFSINAASIALKDLVNNPAMAAQVINLPKINLSQKKGSKLVAKFVGDKFNLAEMTFKEGDLELNLKGESTKQGNQQRLAYSGDFKMVKNLEDQIINFIGGMMGGDNTMVRSLFDAQKSPQGNYSLTVNGTSKQPEIKIGTFTLPL